MADDELEIQDDEDKTLSIEDEGGGSAEEGGDQDATLAVTEEEAAEEDFKPITPPKYKPDSNVYTVMLVLSFIAYAVSLGLVLSEMRDYCAIDRFMWGVFK